MHFIIIHYYWQAHFMQIHIHERICVGRGILKLRTCDQKNKLEWHQINYVV